MRIDLKPITIRLGHFNWGGFFGTVLGAWGLVGFTTYQATGKVRAGVLAGVIPACAAAVAFVQSPSHATTFAAALGAAFASYQNAANVPTGSVPEGAGSAPVVPAVPVVLPGPPDDPDNPQVPIVPG